MSLVVAVFLLSLLSGCSWLAAAQPNAASSPAVVSTISTYSFSGVYIPNLANSAADFSASWLVAIRPRFLAARGGVKITTSMAGVTFAMVRQDCPTCAGVMSRDYLDFFVEHLSSTTNQIPNSDAQVFEEEHMRLNQLSKLYAFPFHSRQNVDKRQNETLAVLVFSSKAFSVPISIQIQGNIRIPFFKATFYSVHRYYANVAIFVSDQMDFDSLQKMQLPAWKIVLLKTGLNEKGYATGLPREALLSLMDGFKAKNDSSLNAFKYVYFTEGDQILHMRHQKELYDLIDDSDGGFAIIPHRMNTLPLVQDLPPPLQKVFGSSKDNSMNIPNVELVHEDMFDVRGSCCDDGLYEVAKCNSWWFQCPEWGLKDMNPWLKFGNYGFTMPPATEHRGKCVYSSFKHICDVPSDCAPLPPVGGGGRRQVALTKSDVCAVNARITYLGPHPEVPSTANTTKVAATSQRRYDDASVLQDAPEQQVQQLAEAEADLQVLLQDVMQLRRRIRHSRAQLKLKSNNGGGHRRKAANNTTSKK